MLDFLANIATSFWKVQYCSSRPQNRLSSWWWQSSRRSFKNFKSVEEILRKLTASWLKLRNLLMFTSYRWILEEKRKNSPVGNRNTDNMLPNPHCVPVKGAQQQLEFSLQGNSVLPWLGKLHLKDPMPVFFSVVPKLWGKRWWGQVPNYSPSRHWIYIKSSQTNTFLLVQTKHFILIQVLV